MGDPRIAPWCSEDFRRTVIRFRSIQMPEAIRLRRSNIALLERWPKTTCIRWYRFPREDSRLRLPSCSRDHDHMKYLNKKKTAEEMEQHYQSTSSVDYSLKEGETLVLQLKSSTQKKDNEAKSAFFEQGLNNLSLQEGANTKEAKFSLKPPPLPSTPVSPSSPVQRSPTSSPRALFKT